MGHDGAPDFKIMFLRAMDCEILDTWDSLGLRGTGSTDFVATDAFVPEEQVFSLFTARPQVAGVLYQAGIMALFGFALTSYSSGSRAKRSTS
jgi:alkylation response protein AidB-like acyl-CoA dehydrogenase